jgi:tRNA G18 (ribose-2'-O)-methylase SpoU
MVQQVKGVYVILHNIRSVHNVGSIFRTADAAGIAKIYLTGYTPTPVDRFGRKRNAFTKVSLGAEKTVPFEYRTNAGALIRELRKNSVFCVAVEQSPHSINYRKIPRKQRIAFIFGNEVRGLSPSILKRCDRIAEIPMHGKKESLNVSVVAGIVLFRFA